jgi:Holliday junction resolvasome RuvABC endonuclease subunit
MQQGYSFPPVVVFYDGSDYWLADGFHRVEAATRTGWPEIEVELKLGSRRDAILYAVGSNATHGLKRTPADKRHAVQLLLKDEQWCQWSDRAIAKHTDTSHPLVAKVRVQVTGNISSERTYITKHGTEARMDTSRIGASRTMAEPSGPCWLGLDPGLAKLRWAILHSSSTGEAVLCDYGEIHTPKNCPPAERLWELERDLVVLLQQFQPTVIALEIPGRHQDYPPHTGTIEAIGVIDLVCYRERSLVPIRLSPRMWKSNVVDGRAHEEEVNETLAMLFDLSVSASQRLDAFALAFASASIGIAYAAFCGVGSEWG